VVAALLEGKTPTAAWRLFRNISQTELANKAGVSCTGLSNIERGLSSGKQIRRKLACALGVPAEALIA
jgi:transcriptional regulator with XRE-family HTH domain